MPYYNLENRYGKGEVLDEMVAYFARHEVAHFNGFDLTAFGEMASYLLSLGAAMDKKVNGEEDIVQYLNTQTFTYSRRMRAIMRDDVMIDLSKFKTSLPYNHIVAKTKIQSGLIDLSKKIYSIDSKYPADPLQASDQQIQAMARLLYDRLLKEHYKR